MDRWPGMGPPCVPAWTAVINNICFLNCSRGKKQPFSKETMVLLFLVNIFLTTCRIFEVFQNYKLTQISMSYQHFSLTLIWSYTNVPYCQVPYPANLNHTCYQFVIADSAIISPYFKLYKRTFKFLSLCLNLMNEWAIPLLFKKYSTEKTCN